MRAPLILAGLAAVASKQFFHLADLRIEPFYDSTNLVDRLCRQPRCIANEYDPSCVMFKVGSSPYDALGRAGCDAPIGLLDSMLAHMKSVNSAPQFILTSGDLVAHGLGVEKGHLVQDQVLKRIRNAFPSTPIIPCVGNHDVMPKNTLSTAEFARLYNLFALHTNIPQDADSVTKFNRGGYFTWTDTANKLKVLMLNTGLVSPKSAPDSLLPFWKTVAQEQFLWLTNELAKARAEGDKVILSGHIPPGRYTTDGDGWFLDEADRFKTLVESYSDVVMIQLFSHFSTELIRSYSPTFGQLVAQGLSPRFSQVASYQHLETSANVVVNASAFGLDLAGAASGNAKWRRMYSLPNMYQVPDVSAASIAATVSKIVNVTDFGGEYVRFQFPLEADVLSAPGNITSQILCETMSMDEAATARCMREISSKTCSGSSGCPTCPTCPTPTACPTPAKCPECPSSPTPKDAPTPSTTPPTPCESCPVCPAPTPFLPPTPCAKCPDCPAPSPTPKCPECPSLPPSAPPTPSKCPECPAANSSCPVCPTAPTPEPCKTCPPVVPCPTPVASPTPDPKMPVCGLTETVCTEAIQRNGTNCIVGRCVSMCSMCAASPTPADRAAARVADSTEDASPSGALVAALVVASAVAVGGVGSALYFRSQMELLKKQMDYMPVRTPHSQSL